MDVAIPVNMNVIWKETEKLKYKSQWKFRECGI
jgi:hypothetical protein